MCQSPITVDQNGVANRVSCGHCQRCVQRRTMSWTLRLLLEKSEHTFTDFVTLTYAPGMEPKKLVKAHFDQFIRRCRRSTPMSVRYFCCGEYGGKTMRPHWHVLLYGLRFRSRGRFHTALWPHGHVHCGEIERPSAMYVCRYTLKTAVPSDHPQIVSASRRPGIGMPALRSLGAYLARKVPQMHHLAPVISYGGQTYWLDPRAYKAMVQAYLAAGGDVESEDAPYNDQLDMPQRSYPIDMVVRRWMKKATDGTL